MICSFLWVRDFMAPGARVGRLTVSQYLSALDTVSCLPGGISLTNEAVLSRNTCTKELLNLISFSARYACL